VIWQDLWAALALVLVLEGMMPFLTPGRVRAALAAIQQLSDRQLRLLGLLSMLGGVILLSMVRS
jgi:uncharacterized protein YjeT (DUF2065 family)